MFNTIKFESSHWGAETTQCDELQKGSQLYFYYQMAILGIARFKWAIVDIKH